MAKSEAEKAAKKAAKAAEAEAAAKEWSDDTASSGGDDFAGVGSGSGDLFSAKDWGDGALLLFYPQRIDLNVTTKFGTEPEVPVGKLVVLDPKNPTEPRKVYGSTSVFGKALMNPLRPAFETRKPTAGVLRFTTFGNGNTGWTIEDSADAVKVARAYIASSNPLA